MATLAGTPQVRALLVHDDGAGTALFAGGFFGSAGGVTAHGLAKWQGSSWSAVGSARSASVFTMAAFDDGAGPALHVAGTFYGNTGVGKWDGSGWTVNGLIIPDQGPYCMAAHDDGSGPALYVGGSSIASGDSYLSKWGFSADLDPPTLACPESVVVLDALGSPSGETVSFSVSASDCRDPAPSVVCTPPSGSFFPRGTTLVTCTATDAAGNPSTCQFPVSVVVRTRRR